MYTLDEKILTNYLSYLDLIQGTANNYPYFVREHSYLTTPSPKMQLKLHKITQKLHKIPIKYLKLILHINFEKFPQNL